VKKRKIFLVLLPMYYRINWIFKINTSSLRNKRKRFAWIVS